MENPKFIVMFNAASIDGKDFVASCTITMAGNALDENSEEQIKTLLYMQFEKWEVNVSDFKVIDLKKAIS